MATVPTLVDTNIVLRFLNTADTLAHERVLNAMAQLIAEGHVLHVTPQNIIEMWNVATRPLDKNGFGLTPAQANLLVTRVTEEFTVLPEIPEVFAEWRTLAVRAGVSGRQVHDTRLVAFMVVHAIDNLLTLNAADFRRFETLANIVVVEPERN